MGGSTTGDYGTGNSSSVIEGMSEEQSCDSVVEWRSCEQVENGIPSTSLPFWDTDDDDDCGAKPSDLYGKFTWKIGNFSQTDKRELRSDVFEIGGYKWYILIYPQGCDVSNHLSLFLCVANHDKLLPGWSHFAQFTIAVVNKDSKKSKNSDTLHRFAKKEHDWGWKKFMELSKISDGFIVEDTLVIDAHVQVIRESAHRLFRCLDRHYRRDLVRIYSSNVEQICRRFVEERRGKLSKLIEDTLRWSSFRSFWVGIDKNAKRRISRDKTDAILKIVVKHFFIEKEVTSTLVMDSLYSGLKAIESQTMNRTGRAKQVDMEELPAPMVCIEKDMFVLADDVLLLLKRTTLEPLPHQPLPPKDDKSPPNRTKDASSGEELNKDSIERDERRLTELGRRTLEIFIITHIFSKIEVAYQEDVALKRQEELIREEEAAGLVENELKAKRGATEKEKRTKKKQAKPKRNSRKGKDRGRDEKSDVIVQDKHQPEIPSDERISEISSSKEKTAIDKTDTLEDASDVSDTGDDASEALQPELDDRDTVSINSDMDRSETHPVADSCSTFSTNLVPPVVANGSHKQNSLPNSKSQTSPIRLKDQQSKDTQDRTAFDRGENNSSSDATAGVAHLRDDADNCRIPQPEPEAVGFSLKNRTLILEQHLVGMEVVPQQKKSIIREPVEVERPSKPRTAESSSTPSSPVKKPPLASQQSKQSSENTTTTTEPVSSNDTPSPSPSQTQKSTPLATRSPHISSSRSEAQKLTTPAKSTSTHQVPPMSRPLSAPIIPSPRATAPVVSTVQTVPLLSRSLSSAGRLGTDPSPSAPSYVPHSYRNTIMGQATMGTTQAGFTPLTSSTSSQPVAYSQSPSAFVSTGVMLGQTSPRPEYTFGSVKPEALHSQRPWRDDYSRQEASNRSSRSYISNHASDISRLGGYGESRAKQHSGVVSSGVAWGQTHGVVSEEFPHLAIINDLLDEDQCTGKAAHRHHHSFNRQYTFPRDVATADIGSSGSHCRPDRPEHYYPEGFQRVYGSSSGPLHVLRDARHAQMDRSAYADGQIDGAVRNQWPYRQSNPAMLNLGIVDADGYSYQLQDDSDSTCGENGYIMYRSSSGL